VVCFTATYCLHHFSTNYEEQTWTYSQKILEKKKKKRTGILKILHRPIKKWIFSIACKLPMEIKLIKAK
jgi:hypothetical protein